MQVDLPINLFIGQINRYPASQTMGYSLILPISGFVGCPVCIPFNLRSHMVSGDQVVSSDRFEAGWSVLANIDNTTHI